MARRDGMQVCWYEQLLGQPVPPIPAPQPDPRVNLFPGVGNAVTRERA